MRISDCSSDVCSSDLGAVSAFIIALFTEMYGFPLTIYLLSGCLQSRYPGVDWFTHDAGHLLEELFGWRGNPHFGPFHLLSFAFIVGVFILITSAWQTLYVAQRERWLVATGTYGQNCQLGRPSFREKAGRYV